MPALAATQYIGISANETRRAKPARDAWLTNRYPLIDMGRKHTDCIEWLDANYPGHPVKRSACHIQSFSRTYTAADGVRSLCEWPLPVTSSISRISPDRSTRFAPSLAPISTSPDR